MEISNRLKAIASFVMYKTIADIGTDHGYIPCFLALNKRINKAVACDINKGPLNKAESNINNYALNGIIETRLGNGLEPLKQNEVDTIIIAGMGGILICDILKKGIKKINTAKQIVLQPQRDIADVRKTIHNIGFFIHDEALIFEGGKYYNIISALKGKESYNDEISYVFGKKLIDKKAPVLKDYVLSEINKYNNIISKTNKNDESINYIKHKLCLAKEVLDIYEMP